MRNFKKNIEDLESRLKEVKEALKLSTKCTQEFLNECGKLGIKVVSVGIRSEKVPATLDFPFGCGGSVFQHPRGLGGKNAYVAIWEVVENLKIGGGCGNSDQHTVSNDNLIEGVYELKGKTWRKLE